MKKPKCLTAADWRRFNEPWRKRLRASLSSGDVTLKDIKPTSWLQGKL